MYLDIGSDKFNHVRKVKGLGDLAGKIIGIDGILMAIVYFALNNYQRFNLILHIAIGLYRIEELEKDKGTTIQNSK